EIVGDRQAEPPRQRGTVADLHREAIRRPVQHRLPVEADDGNLRLVDMLSLEEVFDGARMHVGDEGFGFGENARAHPAVVERCAFRERLAQQGTLVVAVRPVAGRTEGLDALAVGLDQRHIDAVERGAAHQPDRLNLPQPPPLHLFAGPVTPPPECDNKAAARKPVKMSAYKSDFLNILAERGFIHQVSDAAGLDALAAKSEVVAYVGYDCTAPSLHVGHLLSIMMLHWLQTTGNKPIALMGGGTTRVGDPSGKDETRKLLAYEQIDANKASIRTTFDKLIKFGTGKSDAVMADNAEWLTKLNYIEMLREVGRHFSINRMLTMDSAKLRLERDQELSFIEFNYMLLQAYDFVEQAKRYGCNLQMGGSDQWGNIVTGIDLGRRMGTHQLYALTCPLLTTASGAKMGKTAAGAVWLNADLLAVYDYWQFWRNTEDGDVARFLKLFTLLPLAEIAKLAALEGAEINEAKKVLATEATALLHGRDAAEAAARTAAETFETGAASQGLPTVAITRSELGAGLGVLAAFVKAGLVKSNGEARRQIEGGGLPVNDTPLSDVNAKLTPADLADGVIKLSLGRKRHV